MSNNKLNNIEKLYFKVNPKNWGVPDYSYKGSRAAAYAAARKAGEKEFIWNNKRFNTLNSGTASQQFHMYGNTNSMITSKADDKTKQKIFKISFSGNKMDSERLERAFVLNTLSGTPSYRDVAVHPIEEEAYAKFRKQPLEKSKKELMDEYRAINPSKIIPMYNPFTNTIYGNLDISETAHAYRNTEKSEILSFIKDYIKYPFFSKKGYMDNYTNREHFEFDTHAIVEPILNSYLLGEIEKEDIPLYIEKLREKNQNYLSDKNNPKYSFNINDLTLYYPYSEKSNKYKIQRLQKLLSEKGYKLPKSTKEDGTFDGVFGDETKQGLLKYQNENNIHNNKQILAYGGNRKKLYFKLNPKNWGVPDYSNKKNREQAYSSAKIAGLKEYIYKGKRYNTDYDGTVEEETAWFNKKTGNNYNIITSIEDANYLGLPFGSPYPHAMAKNIKSNKFIDFPSRVGLTYKLQGKGDKMYASIVPDNILNRFDSISDDINNNFGISYNDSIEELPRKQLVRYMRDNATQYDYDAKLNNCADNVCSGLKLDNKGIYTTPKSIPNKLKNKYPTIELSSKKTNEAVLDDIYTELYSIIDHINYEIKGKKEKHIFYGDKNKLISDISKYNKLPKSPNPLVYSLQNKLRYLNYNLPKSTKQNYDLDGIWGEETKQALLDWQSKKKTEIPNEWTQKLTGNTYDMMEKKKYFLGAVLPIAQLGLGIYNTIQQNKLQKEQVAEQNKMVQEQNTIAMKQRLDTEDVVQRNFASNTPLHSMYANGGVKPTSTDASIVYGNTHAKGGVDYGNIEVEGGGNGTSGEVIKHEGDNDFIFSDRIMIDDKNTYADIAKQFVTQKGNMEKATGLLLKNKDKLSKKLNTSGSKLSASTIQRNLEKIDKEINENEKYISKLDNNIEGLKSSQLERGFELGLYNEDGTPKDTGEEQEYSEGGFSKFITSNTGQGIMGLASTGLNLLSNINTARNMKGLKVPSYIPIKNQDTSMVDMSASKTAIDDSYRNVSDYADNNFANPQVAAIIKQRASNNRLSQTSQVEERENTINTGIRDSNISRRLNIDNINNQGFRQQGMMEYQKAVSDINNQSNVVSGFTQDFNKVLTNYREGVKEDKMFDLYSKSFPDSISNEIRAAVMDGVDLQKIINSKSPEDAMAYLKGLSLSGEQLKKYLTYIK